MFEKKFWKKAEDIVLFSEPLVKVLRMVDGDKSAMGFMRPWINKDMIW